MCAIGGVCMLGFAIVLCGTPICQYSEDRETISKVLRDISKSLDEEVKGLNKLDTKLVKRSRVPTGISFYFSLHLQAYQVY